MSNKKVGYKQPPEHTRFKRGTSGNPKGRPKTEKRFKPVKTIVREWLLDSTKIRINGQPRELMRLEALMGRLYAMAMNENVQAAKTLLALADKHIPDHLSLEDIRGDRPVFDWTEEDSARFKKVMKNLKLNALSDSPTANPPEEVAEGPDIEVHVEKDETKS